MGREKIYWIYMDQDDKGNWLAVVSTVMNPRLP
jgi:hypothetical protein